jgi:hypothetical protein
MAIPRKPPDPPVVLQEYAEHADEQAIAEVETALVVVKDQRWDARFSELVGSLFEPVDGPANSAAGALSLTLRDIDRAPLPDVYKAAVRALRECVRVDECADLASKAEALASYARQAKDNELRAMAGRIQARAVRRCGELLAEFKAARGKRTDLEEPAQEESERAGLVCFRQAA